MADNRTLRVAKNPIIPRFEPEVIAAAARDGNIEKVSHHRYKTARRRRRGAG
jgi:hypothetical protein